MLPEERPESQRQKRLAMIREAHVRHIMRKADRLAREAIDEMSLELLNDGGVPAVLKGVAVMLHGGVLPTALAARLEQEAAKIRAV